MNIAVLMTVCDGEERIAADTLYGLAQSCLGGRISLVLIDDASRCHIGKQLAAGFAEVTGHAATCIELPSSLGYQGTMRRVALGLEHITESGFPFDIVIKLDPDACIVRGDLLALLQSICPHGVGFFGERYPQRWRDVALLLADYLPFGFARRQTEGVVHKDFRLDRRESVWWADLGRAALARGYRLDYFAGGFLVIGGDTLRKVTSAGWLVRDQRRIGFVFADDVLLTIAAHAIGDPVVDLCKTSPHWGFLRTTADIPIHELTSRRPYVVHSLKDHPKAWSRRRDLKAAFGWRHTSIPAPLQVCSSGRTTSVEDEWARVGFTPPND